MSNDEDVAPVQHSPVQPKSVQPEPVNAPVQLPDPVPEPSATMPVQPEPAAEATRQESTPERRAVSVPSPARDRARAAARRHAAHHGDLPTVTQLMDLAEVSLDTAGTALQNSANSPPSSTSTENTNTRTQP